MTDPVNICLTIYAHCIPFSSTSAAEVTIPKLLAKPRPQEANAEFAAWKLWVGVNCTWLYIGSQDAWAVFIIYLFFRSLFAFVLKARPFRFCA